MKNSDALAQLTSLIGQKQNEVEALQVAITLLQSGFQSEQDSAAIAKAELASKVSAALV